MGYWKLKLHFLKECDEDGHKNNVHADMWLCCYVVGRLESRFPW